MEELRGSDYVESLLQEKLELSSSLLERGPFLYVSDIRAHGFYFRYMDKEKRNSYLKERFNITNGYKKSIFSILFEKKERLSIYFPGMNKIVSYLHSRDALFIEGITRFAGRIEYCEIVRRKLSKLEDIECKDFSPYELINGIKMFVFKDMNGIFNEEAYYIISRISISKLENMCILFLNCLISIMGADRGYLFIYYLKCLGFMAKMENKTMMNSRGLAIIFTPIFIGQKRMKNVAIETLDKYFLIFEKIIHVFK